MTPSKNKLRFDFNDMPDLKAALGGLAPGDRCKVEFELMVVSNDDNGLEGDIESVEYETGAEEGEEAESGSAEPTSDEPILAVISRRNERKKKKPKADVEPASDEADE